MRFSCILPYLFEDGKLCDTLLIGPPGCGKTTLLRDLIRQLSSGSTFHPGMTVGVVRSALGNQEGHTLASHKTI